MVKRLKSRRAGDANQTNMAVDDWAGLITASWQKAVASIIETASLLAEAKEKLEWGEWGRMVEKLPFGRSTADKLVSIAKSTVLTNSELIPKLPASWGTLYEMTLLPEEALERLLTDGKINPDTRHRDVVEIIKQHREEGLYIYEQVPMALNTIAKFAHNWPDPSDFIDRASDEMYEHLGLGELEMVRQWLDGLYKAWKAEEARAEEEWDRQSAEDDEAKADNFLDRLEKDNRGEPIGEAAARLRLGDDPEEGDLDLIRAKLLDDIDVWTQKAVRKRLARRR